MRGLSLMDFLNGPATRGPRFRSGRFGAGRLKHAPKYRRPGDSPVMQAWDVPSNGDDVSKLNGIDFICSFASSNGAEYPDHFVYVPHPEEPDDLDKPVRCPPPEPCIVHDGIVFKDRLTHSRRRTSDLLGSMRETDHLEYYSTPPNRRRSARGSKEMIHMPALIAPDLVATKIVD
ncbi:hypothetical protein M758_4G235400 [Ceratodon purpureus]|uniref:Uncharacterized protein n=1 Tax=Ceratodon purpureus TaxID=3225 RepID=A0A8T0IDW9_CERPU|nr:hypothetical protein KC19_4G231400 [Ceratodon purpureus]KAG0620688.1 hypothetical protein M758_4G235400 [Ceratodon purpureus]